MAMEPKDRRSSVVIVDDESLITRPVAQLLTRFFRSQRLPYKVISSQSPSELLETLRRDQVDVAVAISDIMMEPMGGVDFLRELKTMYPEVMLIVLTGFVEAYNAQMMKEDFQLFGLIRKPWNNATLIRMTRNAFESHRNKKLLNRYVPTEIVQEVFNSASDEILTGRELEATILFIDIRNSTQFFHNGAKEGLRRLNIFFTHFLEVVNRFENGILDKFSGDGMMVLFGVPESHSKGIAQDARDAVLAALQMREIVHRLNVESGGEPVRIGVGISTGPVVAGNIGSEERANYTVVGHDVNVAARLEREAKSIEDSILISEQCFEYAKDVVEARERDPLEARATRSEVRVYEVLRIKAQPC